MSENNDTSNESNSIGSDSILQVSRLGNSIGMANPILRSGVLRPSVLGPSVLGNAFGSTCSSSLTATSGTPAEEVVEDGKSNTIMSKNPFMKAQEDEEEKSANNANGSKEDFDVIAEKEGATTSRQADKPEKNVAIDDEEVDERPDPLKLLRKNGLERANLFAAAKSSIPRVERSGFVFGQNVHERVVGENLHGDSTSKDVKPETSSSEMLFSSVIQNASNKTTENDTAATKDTDTKTLTDVAREYEESRAQKRKYEEVETFTGEENEVNVIDISCKLFAFVNSNWEERGRGNLRLNDSKVGPNCSRVVFRTSGNLRLLVNTKVWRKMVAERPSQKSLRFTAMDNNASLKIFLALARPADINRLHDALTERIRKQQSQAEEDDDDDNDADSEQNVEDVENGASVVNNEICDEPEHEPESTAVEEAQEGNNKDVYEPSPKKSISTSETQN